MISGSDLLKTLDSIQHPSVLVVGDFILDLYTWGDAERISQEAPVIILRSDHSEYRLGGAGNVCQLVGGLEANVTCAGVVGAGEDGKRVRSMLEERGVSCQSLLVAVERPTTTKQRYIGRAANRHPHQILRVDHEHRGAITAETEDQLLQAILPQLDQFDVILISDYGKGVCTPRLLREVISAAGTAGVPIVVDPINREDYTVYRGATAVTPNRREAEIATGTSIDRPEEALRAAAVLCEQADFEMAFVTLDRDGIALFVPGGEQNIFATRPRAVYDITGAGDMVLATIGVCLAANITPAGAAQLANVTGGLEVEQIGAAVIRRDEIRHHLTLEQQPAAAKVIDQTTLNNALDACRARGQRIVFTNGCFDLLHVGHITYLQQAATTGDLLVIGLNSDQSVRRLKGPKRPVIGQEDRAAILAALACVDYVVVFDEETPENLIRTVRPDILVKGGDYRPEDIVGRDFVESYGGQVVVTPIVEGVSTTKILKIAAA
ncbi:MAG: D-glycero-beta-D-manno-heptose 1-phosphate adenylyltransferase [Pirellulales bacterium]